MKRMTIPTCSVLLAAVAGGCAGDIPTVGLGLDDVYYVRRMQKLPLAPALTGAAYRWTVDGKPVSDSRDYIFLSDREGSHVLTFEIIDDDTPFTARITVNVMHEEVEYSPYISEVYEYCPAPGQFVNEMPPYEDGDTYADMLRKVKESISGKNDVLVSLGGFGGYVTFGFDHTVVNVHGENDFRVWGNAFYELTDPSRPGGSAEPGIVMVSYDTNCNGLPDDEWYELRGSAHDDAATLKNYSITYHRPAEGHAPVPDASGWLSDIYYIPWEDSEGRSSHMPRNIFHTQDYYPRWVEADELTFSGTRLPDNAEDSSGDGAYFILYCYDRGYVDNHPNDNAELNSFDISDAVDADGNPVDLPGADFMRVYTGINQYCGRLGETSTEICRARDLHVEDTDLPLPSPLIITSDNSLKYP